MPLLKQYRLFISHSWKYGDEYERFIRLLDGARNFKNWDYSCPSKDPAVPAGSSERYLLQKLED